MSEIIGRTHHQTFLLKAYTNSASQNKELRSSKTPESISPAIVDTFPAIVDITKLDSIRIKSKTEDGAKGRNHANKVCLIREVVSS